MAKRYILIMVVGIMLSSVAHGMNLPTRSGTNPNIISDNYMEEIILVINVKGLGRYEMLAMYINNEISLPVMGLFNLFGIPVETDSVPTYVSGFFLREDSLYHINVEESRIALGSESYPIAYPDMVVAWGDVFIHSRVLDEIFGIYCTFDSRFLTMQIETEFEPPVTSVEKQNKARMGMNRLRGTQETDTVLGRTHHNFRPGALDYNFAMSENSLGAFTLHTRLKAGLEVLGGETQLDFLHYTDRPYQNYNQRLVWNYKTDDHDWLRNVRVGSVGSSSIIQTYSPLMGISAGNAPNFKKDVYDLYELQDYTEPNWIVELYVNNMLVDWQQADENGSFTFQIPRLYGETNVQLMFFGPAGQQRYSMENIYVPSSAVPAGEFIWNITSAGTLRHKGGWFTRTEGAYGLRQDLSLNAGIETFNLLPDNRPVFFTSATYQPSHNWSLKADLAMNVKYGVDFNIRFFRNLSLRYHWEKMHKGQQVLYSSYQQKHQIDLQNRFTWSRYRLQTQLQYQHYSSGLSSVHGLQVSQAVYKGPSSLFLTTYSRFWQGYHTTSSALSVSHRLNPNYIAKSGISYHWSTAILSNFTFELERTITSGSHLALRYSHSLISSFYNIGLTWRHDLTFARTSNAVMQSGDVFHSARSISGSVSYDTHTGTTFFRKNNSVGKGHLTIVPFLDINHNGVRDPGEPAVVGLNVRVDNGRTISAFEDTIVRISDLEPYKDYIIALDENNFDDIYWKIENRSLKTRIDPNQFKRIDVPVLPHHEVYGFVAGNKPARVYLYNRYTHVSRAVSTMFDGSFHIIELPPGNYIVSMIPLDNYADRAVESSYAKFFNITASAYAQSVGEIVLEMPVDDE